MDLHNYSWYFAAKQWTTSYHQFIDSADKLIATPLYDLFVNLLRKQKIPIKTGIFGADMKINLINDGPVTIMLESKKWKKILKY